MRHGPELVTFSKTELEQVDHEVDGAGCFGGSDTAESGQVYRYFRHLHHIRNLIVFY